MRTDMKWLDKLIGLEKKNQKERKSKSMKMNTMH